MKELLKNLVIVLVALGVLYGIWFYYDNLRGAPAITPAPQDVSEVLKPGVNQTDIPLKLPDGFNVEVFAKNLSGVRVMALGSYGMWISRTNQSKITLLEIDSQGFLRSQKDILSNLRNPHGVVVDPDKLVVGSDIFETIYIAEENKVSKYIYLNSNFPAPIKIADLPTSGGGHFTRTLGFGPDGRLYVSIGSSCNVCHEGDERRAAIYSMNPDGSDFQKFASGLRNTVFFTWDKNGKLWGTDMGRDLLGDNVPPDEINIVESGKDYGWPICYDDNIHDTNFDKNQYIRDPCSDKVKPQVKLQAHSAPLGLAFIPKGFGPADWEGDLIVAFHGSWNRSVPTGYKLVRIKLDALGNYEGVEDFITGWLSDNSALGRPVGVVFQGTRLYVSDDKAGVIYKITYGT